MRSKHVGSPRQVSDIDIKRVYEVACDDHGVIDAPRTYAEAVRARRDHWFGVHNAGRGKEPSGDY